MKSAFDTIIVTINLVKTDWWLLFMLLNQDDC
ncbi:hypothetical protein CPS_1242 [Colwellia psychrerythraea 34H]|uniref:Uncharacterized protein n=1 Tax=Colwellia psychrerythraea (strain 34H / ATCC BAA-681) TaxID=167879 RepID=Q486N0_COLP3|nr:hypothetical protein CPS_1242 [Colwellia psychrerythraea 34H]